MAGVMAEVHLLQTHWQHTFLAQAPLVAQVVAILQWVLYQSSTILRQMTVSWITHTAWITTWIHLQTRLTKMLLQRQITLKLFTNTDIFSRSIIMRMLALSKARLHLLQQLSEHQCSQWRSVWFSPFSNQSLTLTQLMFSVWPMIQRRVLLVEWLLSMAQTMEFSAELLRSSLLTLA